MNRKKDKDRPKLITVELYKQELREPRVKYHDERLASQLIIRDLRNVEAELEYYEDFYGDKFTIAKAYAILARRSIDERLNTYETWF